MKTLVGVLAVVFVSVMLFTAVSEAAVETTEYAYYPDDAITSKVAQRAPDSWFNRYIRNVLLRGVKLWGVDFLQAGNSNVVAAYAVEKNSYSGHLYVFSRTVTGSKPTKLLELTADSISYGVLGVKVDDTSKTVIVTQSYNGQWNTLSIYNAGQGGQGGRILKINVYDTDPDAITFIDTPGSRITINIFPKDRMGTQIVLSAATDATSIVSRNDHYVPQAVLNSLPRTISNSNIVFYTTKGDPGSTQDYQYYNFFKKDGTYLLSADKSWYNRGSYQSSIVAPDASLDGRYIAVAYKQLSYHTGALPEQVMEIYDTQTGKFLKSISLLAPSQDIIQGIKFSIGSNDRIEVKYKLAGTKIYSIKTGGIVKGALELKEKIKTVDATATQTELMQRAGVESQVATPGSTQNGYTVTPSMSNNSLSDNQALVSAAVKKN